MGFRHLAKNPDFRMEVREANKLAFYFTGSQSEKGAQRDVQDEA